MAWEESASIDWAREMRGIFSIAKAVAPLAAIRSTPSGFVSGARKPISTASPSFAASSADGGATLTIASASQGSPVVAPASS